MKKIKYILFLFLLLHTSCDKQSNPFQTGNPDNYQFDVIIMADVIEHFDNLFETMSLIEKNLKPGGILIFTTFNMDSIFPKLMGKKYHWIMPYHLYYFSNFTLKNLCEKNNLEIFKIKNDTRVTSFGYLMHKFGLILPKLAFNLFNKSVKMLCIALRS